MMRPSRFLLKFVWNERIGNKMLRSKTVTVHRHRITFRTCLVVKKKINNLSEFFLLEGESGLDFRRRTMGKWDGSNGENVTGDRNVHPQHYFASCAGWHKRG